MKKIFLTVILGCIILPFISCNRTEVVQSMTETELFDLSYGNFEEQLSIADLNAVGNIRIGVGMRDGFFYIVDGFSKKVMELNSYGDLLTLFYNEDAPVKTMIDNSSLPEKSIHHEIPYNFDYPGIIAVDSNKCIYTVCTIPRNRFEQSEDGLLYSQAVLRFERDGTSVDYIGQQGPGGTPFPHIMNIYVTQKDELVVVCRSMDGVIVYWYAKNGFLKYMLPLNIKDVPTIEGIDSTSEVYVSIENVIPDAVDYKLFAKVDYYSSFVDEDSKVQSGVSYMQSLLYEISCDKGLYENPYSIPPYEEEVVKDYSRLTYRIPYDFLGVTQNGWKFFIIKTQTGFTIEMIQAENKKIMRRNFEVNHRENCFHKMYLSLDGKLTALYMDKDKARVVWYRTDTLIDSNAKE